jgi:hypothetical protein
VDDCPYFLADAERKAYSRASSAFRLLPWRERVPKFGLSAMGCDCVYCNVRVQPRARVIVPSLTGFGAMIYA